MNSTEATPSPGQIAIFPDEANKRKLRTTLRPLLDEVALRPDWRGLMKPANPASWFASYQSFLLRYAPLALSADLVLAGVGISGQSGAYSVPYNPVAKGPAEPQIQQRWFQAACEVVRTRKLAGIYFWVIYFGSIPPPMFGAGRCGSSVG